MHYADDLVMCLGDFNGHVGRHFCGLHGGHSVGYGNLEGRLILDFCLEKELCVKYVAYETLKQEGDIQN